MMGKKFDEVNQNLGNYGNDIYDLALSLASQVDILTDKLNKQPNVFLFDCQDMPQELMHKYLRLDSVLGAKNDCWLEWYWTDYYTAYLDGSPPEVSEHEKDSKEVQDWMRTKSDIQNNFYGKILVKHWW